MMWSGVVMPLRLTRFSGRNEQVLSGRVGHQALVTTTAGRNKSAPYLILDPHVGLARRHMHGRLIGLQPALELENAELAPPLAPRDLDVGNYRIGRRGRPIWQRRRRR